MQDHFKKHFKDIEYERNALAADVIGFAVSRQCKKNESTHLALKRFRLIGLGDTKYESSHRPYHGLALYSEDYLHVQNG